MSIVLVLGKKLLSDGSLHPNYVHRLDTAGMLSRREDVSRILISGGATRSGYPSEAVLGRRYLQNYVDVPIDVEEESATTLENLAYSEKLIIGIREEVLLVISQSSLQRVSTYCAVYHPHLYEKTTIIPAKSNFTLRDFAFNVPFYMIHPFIS